MKNVTSTSDILRNTINWQTHYLSCEDVKSELTFYSKDLRFMQQLLNRYFDEMIQNENLDEMRETLMRFQDLCYNCERLKKKVKEQQSRLIDTIKGLEYHDQEALLKEQSRIENRKSTLMKDFKMVKKEMFTIADHVLQLKDDNAS